MVMFMWSLRITLFIHVTDTHKSCFVCSSSYVRKTVAHAVPKLFQFRHTHTHSLYVCTHARTHTYAHTHTIYVYIHTRILIYM